ncbi:WD40/YVTN/BNR-like repeat-containing protein [Paenibacillus glufosinatiresistens]|uniref:WD40/YVTN/BNR-like repeat-containing protein n=1 Tax=Paenibacillus glufosinatiresistens TaxID=3070657 RepID=UPI00286D9A9D|nr:hypothetical protein [Paenibacillus sp. YX.27]
MKRIPSKISRIFGAGLASVLLAAGCGGSRWDLAGREALAAPGAAAGKITAFRQGTVYGFDSASARSIAYDAGHAFRLGKDGQVLLSYNRGRLEAAAPLHLFPPGTGDEERQSDQSGFYLSPELTAIAYSTARGADGTAPIQALISNDAGRTWTTNRIDGSQAGSPRFIGFRNSREGWTVTTAFQGMGREEHAVYLTSDGGRTWRRAPGNMNDVYARVMTGAGFVSRTTGFAGFRYEFADFQPAILQTRDGGRTWSRLRVKLPGEFSAYGLTPLSPVFFGAEGRYPVLMSRDGASDIVGTLTLVSHDYGRSWAYDAGRVRWN